MGIRLWLVVDMAKVAVHWSSGAAKLPELSLGLICMFLNDFSPSGCLVLFIRDLSFGQEKTKKLLREHNGLKS